MRFLHRLRLRLEYLLDRERFDRELRDEMSLHVDLATEARHASGQAMPDARAGATRQFGSVARLQEDAREVFSSRWFESFMQDMRYAARSLGRAPVFTMVSVVSLMIGIGAVTALLALVNAVLFTPLRFREPQQLMLVFQTATPGVFSQSDTMPMSFDKADVVRQLVPAFASVGAFSQLDVIVSPDNQSSVRVASEVVDAAYLSTLGVTPQLGRLFVDDDDREGAAPTIILGHALWQRAFGGDSAVLGGARRVLVNGAAMTVVGIMPAGFHGLSWENADLWISRHAASPMTRGRIGAQVIARLKPDVRETVAAAQLVTAGQVMRERFPPRFPPKLLTARFGAGAISLAEARRHPLMRPLLLLFALATATILVVVCANLGSLLVARGRARASEFGVRLALGAGRLRLVRQLCTEMALLALLGGAGGLLLAYGTVAAIARLHPSLPPSFTMLRNTDLLATSTFRPDLRVVGGGLLLMLLVTGVCGVIPALGVTRLDLIARLRQQAVRGTRRDARGRRALVATEMMLATALLIGAGLMLRSVQRLLRVDTGLETAQVLMMDTQGIRSVAADSSGSPRRALLAGLSQVPGVLSVSSTRCAPFSGGCMMGGAHVLASPSVSSDDEQLIELHAVEASFFSTLRVSFVEGRLADIPRASRNERRIALNQTAARRFWPNAPAIGAQLKLGNDSTPYVVTAVVRDVKYGAIESPSMPALYLFDDSDATAPNISLLVRTDRPLTAVLPLLRQAITDMEPTRAVVHAAWLDDAARQAMSGPRFIASLLTTFGIVAMFLAALGVYGVLAYMVAQRTREFGIRMALGASTGSVQLLVVRQGIVLMVLGVIAGAGIGYVSSASLAHFLFGVGRADVTTYVSAALAVLLAGGAAAVIPAIKATRIAPNLALRAE